jgi:hypothetical protein
MLRIYLQCQYAWFMLRGYGIEFNNCPTRCDLFSLLHFCRQPYMFRMLTPIIRSSYNCNYSFWYWLTGSATIRSRCWVGTDSCVSYSRYSFVMQCTMHGPMCVYIYIYIKLMGCYVVSSAKYLPTFRKFYNLSQRQSLFTSRHIQTLEETWTFSNFRIPKILQAHHSLGYVSCDKEVWESSEN